MRWILSLERHGTEGKSRHRSPVFMRYPLSNISLERQEGIALNDKIEDPCMKLKCDFSKRFTREVQL